MKKVWPEISDLPDPNDPLRAQFRALRCVPGEIASNVLVPGDPFRAAKIAKEWFDDAKLIQVQREFHSYTGTYKGIPVSVISTGIGCPGAAMVMQDLGKLECQNVIRVGTAGSCNQSVIPGDNVIGIAAVRDEGLTKKFLPLEYPAIANYGVVDALKEASEERASNTHVGIVHTSDAFSSPSLEHDIDTANSAGVMAFEMEAAAILMLGSLNYINAGCIFSIDGFVKNVSDGNVIPDAAACNRGIDDAIETALDALVALN
ncbi:MAG: nucleoside phosphorylase [Woeseiaceae bacterium]|jgi:DeoD family purine-nucleoside phosphorylase|nr:nucleoside phosphorylase [Woeseiaceae bacterium]